MTGKVAIITGSGSGIGSASALSLARRGWNIVINYASRIDSARDVAKQCETLGAQTLLCKANVAEDSDCRRMATEAMTKWGRIDALVNSAGTTRFADHANLDALSDDERQALFDVERLTMTYLPRVCNHCVNPACVASCPSGAMYKRGEDGIVLVNQKTCRGWRAV